MLRLNLTNYADQDLLGLPDALQAARDFEQQLRWHQLADLEIRALRNSLAQAQATVANQLGKPTAKPTLRWIFQCFMSIHLVRFAQLKQISNLTSEPSRILQFFWLSLSKILSALLIYLPNVGLNISDNKQELAIRQL